MFNASDAGDFEIVTDIAAKAAVWKEIRGVAARCESHDTISP